ncbi:two-component system sensor histidine kinase LytS [Caldalkalibacillus uzonensis]|uniref:Two-component system sensor histidine kinase LytS n=1 Tax=Caldalkalibacillus uzonensis TaxID=353224 RepID=A0ABU0CNI6_9BACI|nr:LytS/YhcK type 5TM receptor domain-containing protein [Caldalkalibacillus uzonensis]MDQ0337975.1 two-component system sensor histidine kinase LytS [Caldalkalibacillus uzonensis]
MDILTVTLLERIGMLLIAAFIITRMPSIKYLLERELNWKTAATYSLFFGLFGIGGVLAGVSIYDGQIIRPLWLPTFDQHVALAHSGTVGVVMAGLLGGPVVGLGAGALTGLFLLLMGGISGQAYAIAAPFVGLLAGGAARFFSEERIISPAKSLFIGMFAIILTMCFILAFTTPSDQAISLVNQIGIPMVIVNSLAIAVFTIMIRAVLNEKEQAQAIETERALKIADKVLPYLKRGLNYETAHTTAHLLMNELEPAAVAVANDHKILAHIGLGADHHTPNSPLSTAGDKMALYNGHVQVISNQAEINCTHPRCPLKAAILIPFHQSGKMAGLIKLYYKRPQQIRAVDIVLAQGLGRLISNQLHLAEAERMKELIRDAELRQLQAQINPHFLFNTLNTIVSLIRINPAQARTVTRQLAQYMRINLNILSQSLIPIEQELEHLQTYLDIILVRFSDQLQIEVNTDPNLSHVYLPPSTLQPLVENSIRHGLKNKRTGGKIMIQIKEQQDHVYVCVEDNGTGIPHDVIDRLGKVPMSTGTGNGIGIYNVNQRLITLLGEGSALCIRNKPDEGCQISFAIPHSIEKTADPKLVRTGGVKHVH